MKTPYRAPETPAPAVDHCYECVPDITSKVRWGYALYQDTQWGRRWDGRTYHCKACGDVWGDSKVKAALSAPFNSIDAIVIIAVFLTLGVIIYSHCSG